MTRDLDEIEMEMGKERTMKAQIRDGAKVGQDHGYHEWHGDTVFDVAESSDKSDTRRRLTAIGYGKYGHYGNGALWVDERDLIPVEPERVCPGLLQRMGMATWADKREWFVMAMPRSEDAGWMLGTLMTNRCGEFESRGIERKGE